MKKTIIVILLTVLMITLGACEDSNKVTIPDLTGMEYGDVLSWSFDNDIDLETSSEYNDSVLPGTVFYQDIEAGFKVEIDSVLVIKYSRGYDPEGIIEVPDFSGESITYIKAWLEENDISKFGFFDTFDLSIEAGVFVGYEVGKVDERDEDFRKDFYSFYFSKGTLDIEEVEFLDMSTIRGVNLGGWFVLEGWMTPTLFEGVSGSDETIFMEEKVDAEAAIEEHWDTFIVEEDFQWLSDHGIGYIRLPIPWWYNGDGIYHDSKLYIERAMLWAEEYDIKVLLDLHTAPGCQNGFDNGGITGVLEWPEPDNVLLTVEVIGQITEDFSVFDSLWGIEVLNEPGWGVNMTILQNYYLDAYDAIRVHNSDVYVGFHDGFRNYDYTWTRFFTNNEFTNVFFDIHLYQTFGDGWGDFDIFDHVDFVHKEQKETIERYDGIVPIVIGEWSLGLQGNVYDGFNFESINMVKMAFGAAQFNEYENTFGWFFWSYKIDRDSHLEWDFKRLIEQELIPDFYNN